jgi:hypothetical protein
VKKAESRERKAGNVRLWVRFPVIQVGVVGERCQEGQIGSTEHTENTEKEGAGTNGDITAGNPSFLRLSVFLFSVFSVCSVDNSFPRPLLISRGVIQVRPMPVIRGLRFPDSTRGLRGLPLRPFSRFLWLSSGVAKKNGHKKREEPRKERQDSPRPKGNWGAGPESSVSASSDVFPLIRNSSSSAVVRSQTPVPWGPTAPQPLPNRHPTDTQPTPNRHPTDTQPIPNRYPGRRFIRPILCKLPEGGFWQIDLSCFMTMCSV